MVFGVKRESRRHSSGTKDYHLLWISNSDTSRFLLVTRWAKAGQWGNGIKTLQFTSMKETQDEWDRTKRSKFKRGEYDTPLSSSNRAPNTVDELRKELGVQYWTKLGDHLEWLIPGVGMAGVTPEEPATWSDKDKRFVKPRATNSNDFVNVESPEEVEDLLKENPQWGSW